MNIFASIIKIQQAEEIVRFLLLWSWQTLLVLGSIWILLKICRVEQPAIKYKVWLFGMIMIALFPLLSSTARYLPVTNQINWTPSTLITPVYFLTTSQVNKTTTLPSRVNVPPSIWIGITWTALLTLWISGIAITFANLCFTLRRVRQARRSAWIVQLSDLTGDDCEKMDDLNGLPIGLSPKVASPMLVGLLRPLILLPADILDWTTAEERAAILRHEESHHKRWDQYTTLLQLLPGTLLFFHPFLRFAFRQMNLEKEAACDVEVLLSGADPQSYAGSLVKVIEKSLSREGRHAYYTAAFASRNTLHKRIEMIMDCNPAKGLETHRAFLVLAIMLLGIVAWLCVPSRVVTGAYSSFIDPHASQSFTANKQDQNSPGTRLLRVRVYPWVITSIAQIHPRFAATLAQLTRGGTIERGRSKFVWSPIEIKQEDVAWWLKSEAESAAFMKEFAARVPPPDMRDLSHMIVYESRVEGAADDSNEGMIFIKAEKPSSIDPSQTILRIDLFRDSADHTLWNANGFAVGDDKVVEKSPVYSESEHALMEKLNETVTSMMMKSRNERAGKHDRYEFNVATQRINEETGEAYIGVLGDMADCQVTFQPLIAKGSTIDPANLTEVGEQSNLEIGDKDHEVVMDASYMAANRISVPPQANALRIVFVLNGKGMADNKLELIVNLDNKANISGAASVISKKSNQP